MEESFTGERKAFSADVGDEPVRDPHLRGIRRPGHSDQPHARALCNRRAGLVGGAPSDVTQQIGVHRCREHGQRLDDLPCGVADGEQAIEHPRRRSLYGGEFLIRSRGRGHRRPCNRAICALLSLERAGAHALHERLGGRQRGDAELGVQHLDESPVRGERSGAITLGREQVDQVDVRRFGERIHDDPPPGVAERITGAPSAQCVSDEHAQHEGQVIAKARSDGHLPLVELARVPKRESVEEVAGEALCRSAPIRRGIGSYQASKLDGIAANASAVQ